MDCGCVQSDHFLSFSPHFCLPLCLRFLRQSMPRISKRSRSAKDKRRNGPATFGKQTQPKRSRPAEDTHPNTPASSGEDIPSTPSPEGSDHHVSDNNSDASVISVDNSDESEEENDIGMSVELLQRLYAVFLPPHLRPKQNMREECRKTVNRKVVYTGESRTMLWRWKTAQKRAAEGCTTLDTFVKIKRVCSCD
jgi:hypothetical protein